MRPKNTSPENHKVRGHLRDVGVTGMITLKNYRGELCCERAVWTQLWTVPKYATTPSFNIIYDTIRYDMINGMICYDI